MPLKNHIERLKERNNKLLCFLETNNVSNKFTEELKLAIEKDYVNKFWTGCKGQFLVKYKLDNKKVDY